MCFLLFVLNVYRNIQEYDLRMNSCGKQEKIF